MNDAMARLFLPRARSTTCSRAASRSTSWRRCSRRSSELRPRVGARPHRGARVVRERAIRPLPSRGASDAARRRATVGSSSCPGATHLVSLSRPDQFGGGGARRRRRTRAACGDARRIASRTSEPDAALARSAALLVSLPVGLRVGPTPHDSPVTAPLPLAAHPVPAQERKTNHVANIKSQIKRIRTNRRRRSATRPSRASSRPPSALPARPSPPVTRRRRPRPARRDAQARQGRAARASSTRTRPRTASRPSRSRSPRSDARRTTSTAPHFGAGPSSCARRTAVASGARVRSLPSLGRRGGRAVSRGLFRVRR